MLLEGGEVRGGAVTLVAGEVIVGQNGVERKHEAVALHFGDDACGGDAEAEGVAAHDGLLGPGEIADGEAVDEDHVWGGEAEGGHGALHGEVGGAEDVEVVDFGWGGEAGGEADAGVVGEFFVEALALGGGDFFGIVQAGVVEVVGEEDGGGEDGAGEAAAADFVDADDAAAAVEAVGLFVEEGGHGRGAKENRTPWWGTCGGEKRRERGRSRGLAARGFLDSHGVLADAAAKVVELGAADLAALGDLDFGNEGAVEGVDALDAFAVAEFAHGDGLALGAAAFADDDAGENLDALFAAFDDSVVDLDGVTDVEFGGVGLHLLTLDLLEDIHGGGAVRAGPVD